MKKILRRPIAGAVGVIVAPLVLVAALLLVPAAAQAAPTRDQSQTVYDQSSYMGGPLVVGQTFTAGVTGKLSQVNLALSYFGTPLGNLTVGIYATSGGLPTGSVLGTGSVSASSLSSTSIGWVSVLISPVVAVRAGTQYAIVISDLSDDPISSGYLFGYDDANPYARGTGLASTDGGVTWVPLGSADLAFQTYVSPSQNNNNQGQNNNGQGHNT